MTLRLLIPFYNVRPWLDRCLKSLQRQSITDWSASLTDDLSDDGSWEIADRFARADSRFTLNRNSEHLYQCGNYQRLLCESRFHPDDICVAVDGDDYLPDPCVFERVLDAYADGSTWLTYGSFVRINGQPGGCAQLTDASLVRQQPWVTSHLRTWRLFLWRKIDGADLLDPTGSPLRTAGDLAFMFPMIEMAGNRRVKFLKSINYVYNDTNPLCNHVVRSNEQRENERYLRSKTAYVQLPE